MAAARRRFCRVSLRGSVCGLTYHRGSLYLIGWAPDHKEIRHWKVDRIEDAELTPVPFQRPEDFDLREHLANSFGVFRGDGAIHVKIRFSPTVARYVSESQWHASQHLTPHKDGTVVAEFDLDHIEEIKRWILSFGRLIFLLDPSAIPDPDFKEYTAEDMKGFFLMRFKEDVREDAGEHLTDRKLVPLEQTTVEATPDEEQTYSILAELRAEATKSQGDEACPRTDRCGDRPVLQAKPNVATPVA